MASHPTEDGFHEIQLNGKQLVFLFMAATVVSVVIFLCGVLVGRGVRTERTVAQSAALSDAPAPDILPSAPVSAPPTIQAGADPRTAAPPGAIDEKTSGLIDDIRPDSAKAADAARAAADKPESTTGVTKSENPGKAEKSEKVGKVEKVAKAERAPERPTPERPTPERPTPVKSAPEKPAPAPKPIAEPSAAASIAPKDSAVAASPTASTASSAPAAATPGDGYAVQVAAVNVRTDADAIARRFSSKGYAAYVEVPPNGTGTVFRVRIGTFRTKHEAETIAAKLQKEEQIKPWVTR
jgi:cell division septation protein DedD